MTSNAPANPNLPNDRDLRVLLANASLDAPRVDLWERLSPDLAGTTRRRKPGFQALRALAAALAVLLVAGTMLAVFSLAEDDRGQPTVLDGAVNDLLLVNGYDSATQRNTVDAFLPRSK